MLPIQAKITQRFKKHIASFPRRAKTAVKAGYTFLLLSLVALIFTATPSFKAPKMSITFSGTTEGNVTIYFLEQGGGPQYTAQNSLSLPIPRYQATNTIVFDLPKTASEKLRIDPGSGSNRAITLKSIQLTSKSEHLVLAGHELTKHLSLHQHIRWEPGIEHGNVKLVTVGPNPVLEFTFPPSLFTFTPLKFFKLFKRNLLYLVAIWGVLWVLSALYTKYANRYTPTLHQIKATINAGLFQKAALTSPFAKHFYILSAGACLAFIFYYSPIKSHNLVVGDTEQFAAYCLDQWKHILSYGSFAMFTMPDGGFGHMELSHVYYFLGDTNGKTPLAMLMAGWYYLHFLFGDSSADVNAGFIFFIGFLVPFTMFAAGHWLASMLFKQWKSRIFVGISLLFSVQIRITHDNLGVSEHAIWFMTALAAIILWVKSPSWRTLIVFTAFSYVFVVGIGQAFMFSALPASILAVLYLFFDPIVRRKLAAAILSLNLFQYLFLIAAFLLAMTPNLLLALSLRGFGTQQFGSGLNKTFDVFHFFQQPGAYTNGSAFKLLFASLPLRLRDYGQVDIYGQVDMYMGFLTIPLMILGLFKFQKQKQFLFILFALVFLINIYTYKNSIILYLMSLPFPQLLINRHYGDLLIRGGGGIFFIFISVFGFERLFRKKWKKPFLIILAAYFAVTYDIISRGGLQGMDDIIRWEFLLFLTVLLVGFIRLRKNNNHAWFLLLFLVFIDLASITLKDMQLVRSRRIEFGAYTSHQSAYRNRLVAHKSTLSLIGSGVANKIEQATFFSDAILVSPKDISSLALKQTLTDNPKIPIINESLPQGSEHLYSKQVLPLKVEEDQLTIDYNFPSSGYVLFKVPGVRWAAFVNSNEVQVYDSVYGMKAVPVQKGRQQVTLRYSEQYIGSFLSAGYIIMLVLLFGAWLWYVRECALKFPREADPAQLEGHWEE